MRWFGKRITHHWLLPFVRVRDSEPNKGPDKGKCVRKGHDIIPFYDGWMCFSGIRGVLDGIGHLSHYWLTVKSVTL